jgi:hypothetical protein
VTVVADEAVPGSLALASAADTGVTWATSPASAPERSAVCGSGIGVAGFTSARIV